MQSNSQWQTIQMKMEIDNGYNNPLHLEIIDQNLPFSKRSAGRLEVFIGETWLLLLWEIAICVIIVNVDIIPNDIRPGTASTSNQNCNHDNVTINDDGIYTVNNECMIRRSKMNSTANTE
ncbi:hypothetical protein DERF_006071 [Dermatophagoides farinae]|uniref:Uncharacterized protein n=1 Tax=Dermatophagoides farinae TaxID=6954 RepID=A0A922LBV5_DERFA|nr:hypothetical protein DERF_006071 [Dermatophagoides farinae]